MSPTVLSVTNASMLRLEIRVEDADWADFTRLEVWRSVLGEAGPYEELSGMAWTHPALPLSASTTLSGQDGPSVNINGKSLQLLINESIQVDITFSGTDPMTYAEAAAQIFAQGVHKVHSFVNADGALVVTSMSAGGSSSLRVLGGDAAPFLGLSTVEPDSLSFGSDPRIPLTLGKRVYSFNDYWNQPSYYYKTCYSNHLTGVRSEFSTHISAKSTLAVDPASVAIGFVRLVRNDGRASSGVDVVVYNTFKPMLHGDYTIVGGPSRFITDSRGYAEFSLLRGEVFDIGIGGTSLIRSITVPTDPTVLRFNVLSPEYGSDDSFNVVRAEIPYAERTTL